MKQNKQRLKRLEKEKIKSLGLVETLTMKYAGWNDGRNGLLRCNSDGRWESSILKQEVDAFEELCANQMGRLKFEEEKTFNEMNVLFDKVDPLRNKLSDAKEALEQAKEKQVDVSVRKEGEENLTEAQITSRRNREHERILLPLKNKVEKYDKEFSDTVEAIFTHLSQVKEAFDSAVKVNQRVLFHSQRKIDVYWHSAMHQMPELPSVPNVTFSNLSEQAFANHYRQVEERAEKLRRELAYEFCEEEI